MIISIIPIVWMMFEWKKIYKIVFRSTGNNKLHCQPMTLRDKFSLLVLHCISSGLKGFCLMGIRDMYT
uniref:Uncharacterized protein n=1 Tax=Anguilla anguilla TaxID=7936 RepID=A0A0E9X124_ANGAN